ncbi:hypothetical protein [Herbidospora sp. NBRC 101105]|uniref:hypothetical protein n=1 Tax=Herbidospora sp. NBRC 101105 TaxID=3032195 RepID=UPI0024A59472|nr:hypothetical protein [Herbidospora sp. NBRC 101105]GLX94309.1 hypothetical protein Hesp01_22590 [Herbidospora sp. NBRC 101105]
MIRELFEDDTFNAPTHRISLKEIDRRAGRIRRRRTALATAAATAVVAAGFVLLPMESPGGSDVTMAQQAPAPQTVYMLAERSVATPGHLQGLFYPGSEGPVQIYVNCPGFTAHAGVWMNDKLVAQGPCGPVTALTYDDHADPDRPIGDDGMVHVQVRAFPYEEGGLLTEAELLARAEEAKDYRMGVLVHVYRYPGLFNPPADCAEPLVLQRPDGTQETLKPVRCDID